MNEDSEINWVTDESGKVIIPAFFGDGELINIGMSLDEVRLKIVNRGATFGRKEIPPSTFNVVVSSPCYMTMTSVHLQNVIEDVYVFDYASMSVDLLDRLGIELDMPLDISANYAIVVTPKTGISGIVLGDRVEVYGEA